jgi:hypothetical protein
MKYIKKLNIDFDNWGELNKCIYLIFKNGGSFYIGYINKNEKSNYSLYILNDNYQYSLKTVIFKNNIKNKSQLNNKYIFNKDNKIKYKDLIETNFYKNNKILIVGFDVNKEDIVNNPELYYSVCDNYKKNMLI